MSRAEARLLAALGCVATTIIVVSLLVHGTERESEARQKVDRPILQELPCPRSFADHVANGLTPVHVIRFCFECADWIVLFMWVMRKVYYWRFPWDRDAGANEEDDMPFPDVIRRGVG